MFAVPQHHMAIPKDAWQVVAFDRQRHPNADAGSRVFQAVSPGSGDPSPRHASVWRGLIHRGHVGVRFRVRPSTLGSSEAVAFLPPVHSYSGSCSNLSPDRSLSAGSLGTARTRTCEAPQGIDRWPEGEIGIPVHGLALRGYRMGAEGAPRVMLVLVLPTRPKSSDLKKQCRGARLHVPKSVAKTT